MQQFNQNMTHVVGNYVVFEEVRHFIDLGIGRLFVQTLLGYEIWDVRRGRTPDKQSVEDSTYGVDIALFVDLLPVVHQELNDIRVAFVQFAVFDNDYVLHFLAHFGLFRTHIVPVSDPHIVQTEVVAVVRQQNT